MLKIEKLPGLLEPRINLGNQNENDTKIIQIDVSAWNALYPGCTYHITAMRPGDAGNWPVTGVSHTDGVLTWVVPNTVTSVPGRGSLVIHCILDGKEKNTGTFGYSVSSGHTAMGEAPDPVADWIDDANVKIGELDESLESANAAEGLRETAEEARETAEGLREGAEISRNTAEGLRDGAETARKEAEALRVDAEAARMGFKPMGAYNPANENKYGEWYTHEGGSYAYINPTPSTGVPLTDTSHWQQIASRGMTGPSAYEAAVAGGYMGTEAEFNAANAGIEAAKDAALDAAQTANEASEIALAISTADTWERVAYFIRLGKGPQVFPVGTILRASHTTYGEILWRVMTHNHDVNKSAPELPTMRIEMIACIYGREADAPELLWANTGASELPAGTYNFTLLKADNEGQTREDGTYQFTTAQAIPVGGGFRHSQVGQWRASSGLYVPANIIGNHLTTYNASGVAIESNLAVTAGSGGTALGTASRNWADTINTIGRFNSTQRNAYGSNHAGEGAVRQWLNSALGANLWWVKKTPFDLKPSYANQPGFLAGFDADFLDALVTVDNICARNTIYEEGGTLGGSYVTADKMFRPSMTELGLGVNNAIAEGAVLDYYEGTTALERIKFDIASPATARYWWLRSPNPSIANYVRNFHPDGALNHLIASNGSGVAPDCVIG